MVVVHTPIIRILDVCQMDTPIKVMVTRLNGDKLWWKHAPVIPKLVTTERNKVKIINDPDKIDKMTSYLFTQLFFNILFYNNFKLDVPQKYYIDRDCTFYYFMEIEKDIIIIPLFFRHPSVEIIFTQFKDRPALKISVTRINRVNTDITNTKRRRQNE